MDAIEGQMAVRLSNLQVQKRSHLQEQGINCYNLFDLNFYFILLMQVLHHQFHCRSKCDGSPCLMSCWSHIAMDMEPSLVGSMVLMTHRPGNQARCVTYLHNGVYTGQKQVKTDKVKTNHIQGMHLSKSCSTYDSCVANIFRMWSQTPKNSIAFKLRHLIRVGHIKTQIVLCLNG